MTAPSVEAPDMNAPGAPDVMNVHRSTQKLPSAPHFTAVAGDASYRFELSFDSHNEQALMHVLGLLTACGHQ